jgi:hypothetical protein
MSSGFVPPNVQRRPNPGLQGPQNPGPQVPPNQFPEASGQYGGINPAANPAPKPGEAKPPTPAPAPWTTTPQTPPPGPVAGPQNPGPQAPPAGGQPWYNQGHIDQYQQWAQQRYGRQATPQELAQIGANSTDMASAQAYSDTLAQKLGWTPPGAPAAPAAPSAEQQNQDLLQKRIQEMLGRPAGDVDTGSQEYQSELGSFKRSQERQMHMAKRNAMARQGAAGGSGGFDSQMSSLDTEGANQVGDFEAGLAGKQIMRQREDLQNAMQLAQQSGMADEARALQEKLGMADVELRKYLGKGQLGLGMLGTLLGNQRAQDALGFNYAQLGQSMNQNMLQQLLAGL